MEIAKRTNTDQVLNELLVQLFKNIMEIEEKYLITPEYKDISVNDMHILEAIGIKEPKSMSAVAKLMSVTTGTLTKSMDGLSDKAYVNRERGKKDKRVVCYSDRKRKKSVPASRVVSPEYDCPDQRRHQRTGDNGSDLCAGEVERLF